MHQREIVKIDEAETLVQTAQLDAMSREDFIELYFAHQPHEDEDNERSPLRRNDDAGQWADKQLAARKKGKR